jgi:FkbM family methyltransferase
MVTVKGLIRTVSIVKNPFAILNMKLRKKVVKVTFSDGSTFQLNWPQFRSFRDNYEIVKKYRLQQINNETFKITTDNYQLIGSFILMYILDEIETGVYEYNYKDKIVLDVGGFEGESAVFFWSRGAKKIVIYEPVVEHHRFIYENIGLNNVNAEVHSVGIGDKDDEITVVYDKADNCFGLEMEKAQNKMSIKIKDISKVIVESGADVAKFDCEGAEISLVSVPNETLRKLEYVIVEAHTPRIRQQLVEKFKSSGFVVERVINNEISIIHFKRV